MKPINLKIKGLNSFIDCQEINFEKLTDKGLFGIFGPTGSGKTTVLDGITLALYGEISRKSTNFMNTNCDSLTVSYEFQMSEKEIKRYRVDREFRRDKTGGIKSKSAKVIDLSDGNEVVLEEGVRTVTGKCEEIIGLKLEDFTRTVVLPQGKFSEFLKLEGKDRRNMLERLFNLQQYGDELSNKLSYKIKAEKQNSNILEGELKGYEEFSEEILKEKSEALNESKKQFEISKAELKNAENNFNQAKELWDLQNELKEVENKKSLIEKNQEEIKAYVLKVAAGESALKVFPYIERYESTSNKIVEIKKQLNDLNIKSEVIIAEKEKTEVVLEAVKLKKENEIPLLKIKEQKVLDAIEETVLLNNLKKEKNLLSEDIKKLEVNLNTVKIKTDNNEASIKELSHDIRDKDLRAESLKVSEEYKRQVNQGMVILSTFQGLKLQLDSINKEVKQTLLNIDESKNNNEIFAKELNNIDDQINQCEGLLKNLTETCPGDQNTLLSLQEKLSYVKQKWDKYNEYNISLEKGKENSENINKELASKENSIIKSEEEIENIKVRINKTETENLAHILREALSEGEMCPVCGSKEHHVNSIESVDLSSLEELKNLLSTKEDILNKLNVTISKYHANLETENNNIKDKQARIIELGQDFKEYSADNLQINLDKLKTEINEYNAKKTQLENKIKEKTETKNNINIKYNKENSTLSHNRELYNKLNQDLKAKNEEFLKLDNELSTLREELSIEDFKKESDEVFKKEKEKSSLEKEIRILRDNLSKSQGLKELLNKESGKLNEELSSKKSSLTEKIKNIEEKESSIKSKVGDAENLESIKNKIILMIKKIEDEYAAAEKSKKEKEEQFIQLNDKKISAQANMISLNETVNLDREALNKVLSEENFNDVNEAKSKLINRGEIEKLKNIIEEYKSSLAKISGTIETLNIKINNRHLTLEQWTAIQSLKEEASIKLQQLTENLINLETVLKTVGEKIVRKNELLKVKAELDHKLSLLSDLESLFKGKKFVEFVAAHQLKYVSMEACKKLKEITGGNYGLEVDENGKFIIRDYKNGGAERDASTLSGGETFVASLALSLALSAQIQLKGTAPLELFFLDEGFGTLDDNLLEVVMDSLERIHHDKLSIGIISHVESIKNRVPVKLIVTPAESGRGGSKVKIERS